MELFFNLEEQLLTTLIPCPTLTLYMLQLLDQTDVQLLPIYMLMSTLFQYVVLLTGDTSICEGSSVLLNGTNTSVGVTYLWNDPNATTTSTLNVSDTGYYELTITDNNGCRAYDGVQISYYPTR